MKEINKTDFSKIRKILKKNSSASRVFTVFLSIFTGLSLIFFGVFFIPDMIVNSPIIGILFILFWFGMLSLFWYLIIKSNRSNRNILKHIDNGTIVIKKPRIFKFEYSFDRDSDGHSDSGYIVFASDGGDVYKSSKISNCIFTGGYGFSVDKNYYIKKQIPYSLNDPQYLNSQECKKVKELEERIKTLYEQYSYADGKEQKNLKKEIKKLEADKISLQPQHLLSRGATFVLGSDPIVINCYIGDEINVYIDPDNLQNYIMEI